MYLFGSSGNMFDMLDLFDKVFFLHVDPELQKERLTHPSRKNPMGQTEFQRNNAVTWGLFLEKRAKELSIPFIDGTFTPQEIIKIIRSQE